MSNLITEQPYQTSLHNKHIKHYTTTMTNICYKTTISNIITQQPYKKNSHNNHIKHHYTTTILIIITQHSHQT
jgi:hypothetical protein